MKVMMFAPGFGLNGRTHVHCMRYLQLLKLAGCEVTFVEHRGIEPPALTGIEYRRFPPRYGRVEQILGYGPAYFLHKQALAQLMRDVQPDICHVQWIEDVFCEIAGAGLRPIVATAWGSDLNIPAKAPPRDTKRRKISAALRQLDLLIVDSEDMIETAQMLAGQSLRTVLLPIGIWNSIDVSSIGWPQRSA